MCESEVAQLCPPLCDSVDCSPPGSSIHGILQARVLRWVSIPFSRGSSQSRDWTQVSRIVGRRFNLWATREAPNMMNISRRREGQRRLACHSPWGYKESETTEQLHTKPLTVWITINCGKFWKRWYLVFWKYQTTWLASWETCMQVRKQQLELDVEQQTGSK